MFKKLELFVAKWMELKDIMLSEISRRQKEEKDKYCVGAREKTNQNKTSILVQNAGN